MDKQDIRYIISFGLIILGLALWFGAVSKMEYEGFITAGEFIARTIIGIVLIVAAVFVSGDLPEIREQIAEKRNRAAINRREK